MIASKGSHDSAPGLYVHVPFCSSKCRYCAFYSETNRDEVSRWLDALLKEASLFCEHFSPFDTLYLGGGSPSLLSDDALRCLLEGLQSRVCFEENLEITIEANAGDVDEARAANWVRMGIQRVSVGVQSFHDEELRWLGRRHDAAEALQALEALRKVGMRSLGIDLIWGLPGQSQRRALSSVERALSFNPEHISCYELTVEEGTPLHRDVLSGKGKMPSEDELVGLAQVVWERLSEAGYDHYEVSNFAKTSGHRSRHNTKYWHHVPYLGLGPSAHSFDGRSRWANHGSLSRYCDALECGQVPHEFREVLCADMIRTERIALGLRTSEGIEEELVDPVLVQDLVREHLLVVVDGRVKPTSKGLLMADGLARILD